MKLGNLVFDNCPKLKAINIPSVVTSIGESCFRGCSALKTITCLPTTPPTWGSGCFNNVSPNVVYVPSSSVDTYKSATGWSRWASVIEAIPQ